MEKETKENDTSTTENTKITEGMSENKETKEVNNNILVIITIILVIVLFGLLSFVVYKKYPQITNFLTNNKYGFDYNINSIKSYDWDVLLTDKKVARALGTAEKNITSQKNPDYAWVLTEPETFANEVICGSLINQQFLNEISEDERNLLNITVMICKNTAKTTELFNSRRDEIDTIANEDDAISIKEMSDIGGFGTDAYYYLIEKKNDASNESTKDNEYFSGLIFRRGPFMIQIEESENPTNRITISESKFRETVARMIDTGIKRSLSAF